MKLQSQSNKMILRRLPSQQTKHIHVLRANITQVILLYFVKFLYHFKKL